MARRTEHNDTKINYIAVVEWEDAASYDAWDSYDEIEKHAQVCPMVSIGFLLTETDKAVRIARTTHIDGEQLEGVFVIPKGMITKMTIIPRKNLKAPAIKAPKERKGVSDVE